MTPAFAGSPWPGRRPLAAVAPPVRPVRQADLSHRRIDAGPPATGGRCRSTHTGRAREAAAARRRIEKFSRDEVAVRTDGDEIVLALGDDERALSDAAAARLRSALGRALTTEQAFVHTAGERRPDGTYVVSRRGADSAGHRKVFDSREALRALYDRLPREFTAVDLETDGLSGGRCHMVLRHLAEHPAFDCSLVARQPLTARKVEGDGE